MTTYLGQLNNRIEINKRKLKSLQEYKDALLTGQEQIEPELLTDRLEQIEIEFSRLKKAIHANRKAEAHYNAAYNHLIALRSLDNSLQVAKNPTEKTKIEGEIIEHTNKLQKHLSIMPKELVDELQAAYLQYAEQNPIVNEEATSVVGDIPNNISTPESLEDITNNTIYLELLEIFEEEKREFNDIKVFATPEDLEKFIDKYKAKKMHCYTHLAMLNSIGKAVKSKESVSTVTETNHVKLPVEEVPARAPIVTMLSLVDGLEIVPNPTQKLHATNIKIADNFKEELKNANWLYNVIHFTSELAHAPEISPSEFISEVSTTARNKERIAIVKERIDNLSTANLMRVYNEYYGGNSQNRLTTVLKVLISEQVNKTLS